MMLESMACPRCASFATARDSTQESGGLEPEAIYAGVLDGDKNSVDI